MSPELLLRELSGADHAGANLSKVVARHQSCRWLDVAPIQEAMREIEEVNVGLGSRAAKVYWNNCGIGRVVGADDGTNPSMTHTVREIINEVEHTLRHVAESGSKTDHVAELIETTLLVSPGAKILVLAKTKLLCEYLTQTLVRTNSLNAMGTIIEFEPSDLSSAQVIVCTPQYTLLTDFHGVCPTAICHAVSLTNREGVLAAASVGPSVIYCTVHVNDAHEGLGETLQDSINVGEKKETVEEEEEEEEGVLKMIPFESFSLTPDKIVRHGVYGITYRGIHAGKDVLVKWIFKKDELDREVRMLSELGSSGWVFLPKVYGLVVDCKKGGGIVTKYYRKTLKEYVLEDMPKLSLDYQIQLHKAFTFQVAQTMRVLVSQKFTHRNLSPASFYVDDGPQIIITDLCGMKHASSAHSISQKSIGYAAPEVLSGQAPSAMSEAYSLGWMLYFIVVGKEVTPDMHGAGLEEVGDPNLRVLIKQLTNPEPENRLKIEEAVEKMLGKL